MPVLTSGTDVDVVIQTRKLRKNFKTRAGVVEAVRGVDLAVRRGSIFGFLGPNGAGKTTTLRMLTTLLLPTDGDATVAGCDLLKEPQKVRQQIGYVSQSGGAEGELTGRENVVLQGQLYGMSTADAQSRAVQLLQVLELDTFASRRVRTYSGGQRRRLDLALGMVHRPALLFLDEPTTGLDPQSRARLWDEVRRLRDGGTTIFITTHYLDEADALCSDLAIIDGGRIVVEGTPDVLKRQIAGDVVTIGLAASALSDAADVLRQQTFVRSLEQTDTVLRLYVERGETALPPILRVIEGTGLSLQTISLARPTLDDVFLHQTGRSLRESDG